MYPLLSKLGEKIGVSVIGVKICMLFSLLILIAWAATRYVGEYLGFQVLIRHELIDHDDDTHLDGRAFQAHIRALREDAQSLAREVETIGDGPGTEDRVRAALTTLLDKDGNQIENEGPATRTTAGYRRAGVLTAEGASPPPIWARSTGGTRASLLDDTTEGERRRKLVDERGTYRAAEAARRRVHLTDIDPETHEIHAVVPIARGDGGGTPRFLVLSLDLKPRIDTLMDAGRMVAFLAKGDDNTLIARSPDLVLNRPVSDLGRGKIQDIDGLVADTKGATAPKIPLAVRSPETAGSLRLEEVMGRNGSINKYVPRKQLAMLVIDIDPPNPSGPEPPVSKDYLVQFQRFLDDRREESVARRRGGGPDDPPTLIADRAIAHEYTVDDYYPYIFVRTSDRGELETIRDRVTREAIGKRATPRAIFACGAFTVRIIRIPIDPEIPGRSLLLGVGVSENELRADFKKEAATLNWLFIAIFAVGLLSSIAITGRLTRPLKQMKSAAEQFAAGRFDAPLPTRSRDEIGVLARAFEQMGEKVREQTEDLRAVAEQTQTILDMAAEGIITIDEDGIIEVFNRAAETILGYRADEIIGQKVDILLPPGADGGKNELLVGLLEQGSQDRNSVLGRVHRLKGRRKDGTEFPMEIAVNRTDIGDRLLLTSIVRDITDREEQRAKGERREREQREELERQVGARTAEIEHAKDDLERSNQELAAARDETVAAMKAQVDFFDQVAHDLRTPLTNVIGYGEFLLERANREGRAEFVPDLNLVVDQGKFLLELINDLLNVSKAMSGKELALELVEFDVREMLDRRMPGINSLAVRNKNRVEVDCPADLGTMFADEVRVWRILMNLLTNSCKFTKRGSIRVTARREAGPDGGSFVFAVSDTGKGMGPDQVARLFNRFEQVHQQSASEGFGLGLSSCSLYCRTMGGEIRVESAVDRGSTFTVRLPAVVTEGVKVSPSPARPAPRGTGSPSPADGAAPDGGLPLVLVVDDDPSFGELMRRNLTAQGFEARIASSGEEGLRLAKQLVPAAILLDVVMAGIDGWAVLAALKTDAVTADIPIIMATMVDDRAHGVALGADDYATKPISRERLGELLRKHRPGGRADRVLVVEDDPETRDRLVRMLAEHGFAAEGVADGQVALERIAAAPPDLILLDLLLPTMDGFEVIARLRADTVSHAIPIIVVTGADLDPETRRRLQGEVVRVLQKGRHGREELFREVRTVVAELRRRIPPVMEPSDA